MNDEMIEQMLYQSGLTAQGCWDELDQYAKDAILLFGNLIQKQYEKVLALDMRKYQERAAEYPNGWDQRIRLEAKATALSDALLRLSGQPVPERSDELHVRMGGGGSSNVPFNDRQS